MQQHFAGGLNIGRILGNFIGDVLPQDHFIQGDNCIDRRADLMAHAGEKVVLCLIQRFDLFFLGKGAFHFPFVVQSNKFDDYADGKADQQQTDDSVNQSLRHRVFNNQLRLTVGYEPAAGSGRTFHQQECDSGFPL